jgi:hypothetical protein
MGLRGRIVLTCTGERENRKRKSVGGERVFIYAPVGLVKGSDGGQESVDGS